MATDPNFNEFKAKITKYIAAQLILAETVEQITGMIGEIRLVTWDFATRSNIMITDQVSPFYATLVRICAEALQQHRIPIPNIIGCLEYCLYLCNSYIEALVSGPKE